MRRLFRYIINIAKTKREKESLLLTITLSPEHNDQLNRLLKDTGLRTRKDLVNNALTLLSWAVNQTQEGRIIASINETDRTYREVLLTALENVRYDIVKK